MTPTVKGLFTQSVSISSNTKKWVQNAFPLTALALPLTLTLCVNRIIYNANIPSKT